jgi:hypothetical protein
MKLNRKEATFVIEITQEVNVWTVSNSRIKGLPAKEVTLILMCLQNSGIITEFRRYELIRYVKSAINVVDREV